MKKIVLFIYSIFLLITLFDTNNLNSETVGRLYKTNSSLQTKDRILRAVIAKLRNFPQSNQLIEEALKGGSITVEITDKRIPFEALWDSAMRKVVIAERSRNDQGALLRHLLFELTNAVSESNYRQLYVMAKNGRIDCDSYVEAVEKIEHENMMRTVDIIEKGIASKAFPSSARWTIIYDFSTHYKIQQLAGHSLLIAEQYQDAARQRGLSPYGGTVANLKKMSKREKEFLIELLHTDYFKNGRKRRQAVPLQT